MVDGFSPEDVWAPFGAFSMGVIQGEGQVVYLKGQVALNKDGQVVGKGDMRAQTRKTLENIQTVLASIGGKMADVVSLTHYVTDINEFIKTGDIRRKFFAKPFPVTTTVQIVRLYRPELLIEITATAEVPRDRFMRPLKRS
jgi:2-iminobutanoate/2-iminopropanoate deaminase